ncbi:hypothetical protein HMPREF2734_04175 [Corynebacterium sp. HMSC055D05]|nr:hypothetical protein HMPREF2734_04175 [Corynebacterium sp. HMSC055D05]
MFPERSTVTEFGSTTTGFVVDEDAEDAVEAVVDSFVSGTVVPAAVLVVVEATGSCASTG